MLSNLVRICSITSIDDWCNPATGSRVRLVNVVDSSGALIPTTSTEYPAAANDAAVFVAIGFVRSYWTDAGGSALSPQPTLVEETAMVLGACGASTGTHGFSGVVSLNAGANVVTHNLGVAAPFPVHVETRAVGTGAIVALRATNYTANSVTLTVPVAQTVVVTITKVVKA
jgi:hypothetical protein